MSGRPGRLRGQAAAGSTARHGVGRWMWVEQAGRGSQRWAMLWLQWEPRLQAPPKTARTLPPAHAPVKHLPPPCHFSAGLAPIPARPCARHPRLELPKTIPAPRSSHSRRNTDVPSQNQMILSTQRTEPKTGYVGWCSCLSDPQARESDRPRAGTGWGSCQWRAFGEGPTMP